MPVNDTLTPQEAAYIATNAYFTLKDWINYSAENKVNPVAGVEARQNIHDRVLGTGTAGTNKPVINTSLKGSALGTSKLKSVHTAQTGLNVESGFGYTLKYQAAGKTHVIVAVRGTRFEMGLADVLTDLRGAFALMGGVGVVHTGFRNTYKSMLPSLERDRALIASADVVHCVGHSLGGAVATLLAAHYANTAKAVKLYTFGSPRVGAFTTHETLENLIGRGNIFRVAHDLDPVSLVGPYPYKHINGSPREQGFMTLISPANFDLQLTNHNMDQYIKSVGRRNWSELELASKAVAHDQSILARALLKGGGDDPSWLRAGCAKALTILLKLFSDKLRKLSTKAVVAFTAVDLLAELVFTGAHKLLDLGSEIMGLMGWAAKWASVTMAKGAKFTAMIIQTILDKMLATLKAMAVTAVTRGPIGLAPMGLAVPGWALASAVGL